VLVGDPDVKNGHPIVPPMKLSDFGLGVDVDPQVLQDQ
jgi:hypothetical protein